MRKPSLSPRRRDHHHYASHTDHGPQEVPASTNNPPMMSNRSTSYLPASLDLLWARVYSPAPRRQEGGSCRQRTRP